MKLYTGRGYQVTSFVAICQTAGLPEHIVRTHYRDESQVFLGVLDRVREYVIEPVIEKIAKAPETAQEKLVAFVHGMSQVASTRADYLVFLILMQIELRNSEEEVRARLMTLVGHLHRTVEGIIKLGWMRSRFRTDLKSAELTALVMGSINGAMLEWYTRRDQLQGRELTRTLRLVLMRGLEDFITIQNVRDTREPTPGFHP